MKVQIHDALVAFGKWAVGRTIRGQKVEAVGLEMDTISQPEYPLRYVLSVFFRENPKSPECSKEFNLMSRVFSEIPLRAYVVTYDVDELRVWMVGYKLIRDSEWKLEDEQ